MPTYEVTVAIICEPDELDHAQALIDQIKARLAGSAATPKIAVTTGTSPTPPAPPKGSNGAGVAAPATATAAAPVAAAAPAKKGRPAKNAAAAAPAVAASDPLAAGDDDPLGDVAGPVDPADEEGDALGLAQPTLSPAEAHEKGMNLARELYGKGHKAQVKSLQTQMGIAKFTDIPVSEGHKFYKLALDCAGQVGVAL